MFQLNDINKEISKKNNIDIKLIEKVNNIYYKEFINCLNSYEDSEIKLCYLGTFKARFSSVKRRIWTLIFTLKKIKNKEIKHPINISEEKSLRIELKELWKIKNEFSIKNYKKKHGN